MVPIVFILVLYYNNYIKYVSLIFLLIGIVGTVDSFYKSIKEKLLGIFIWGVLMHSIGFYPLLNVDSEGMDWKCCVLVKWTVTDC